MTNGPGFGPLWSMVALLQFQGQFTDLSFSKYIVKWKVCQPLPPPPCPLCLHFFFNPWPRTQLQEPTATKAEWASGLCSAVGRHRLCENRLGTRKLPLESPASLLALLDAFRPLGSLSWEVQLTQTACCLVCVQRKTRAPVPPAL